MAKLQTPTRSYSFYNDEIVVDFYEKYGRYNHVYIRRDNGEWLKSVTKATGILDKPALVPWACKVMAERIAEMATQKKKLTMDDVNEAKNAWRDKRDQSADKGTEVHDLASQYINYRLGVIDKAPQVSKSDDVSNAFLAFRDWVTTNHVKFVDTEVLVYSKQYNFVGTLDCLAMINGELCLIDFKSGNGIYWDYVLQVSGYALAYQELSGQKIDRCFVVRFSQKDATFTAKDFVADNKTTKGFLSCLYLASIQKDIEAIVK